MEYNLDKMISRLRSEAAQARKESDEVFNKTGACAKPPAISEPVPIGYYRQLLTPDTYMAAYDAVQQSNGLLDKADRLERRARNLSKTPQKKVMLAIEKSRENRESVGLEKTGTSFF